MGNFMGLVYMLAFQCLAAEVPGITGPDKRTAVLAKVKALLMQAEGPTWPPILSKLQDYLLGMAVDAVVSYLNAHGFFAK